ncbi:hypothetical protein LepocDRAFT_00003270 [Leptothrix ochracea L12]|uniref:Uncharacterized protein n=1 Tax=Leptothrix ochracea L12 TaxID=735332 RepID=I4Z5V3_9BURK|nr:hypothetical protein LepocDRAFT_00003270 [Leptothrix ochracea L12]
MRLIHLGFGRPNLNLGKGWLLDRFSCQSWNLHWWRCGKGCADWDNRWWRDGGCRSGWKFLGLNDLKIIESPSSWNGWQAHRLPHLRPIDAPLETLGVILGLGSRCCQTKP